MNRIVSAIVYGMVISKIFKYFDKHCSRKARKDVFNETLWLRDGLAP